MESVRGRVGNLGSPPCTLHSRLPARVRSAESRMRGREGWREESLGSQESSAQGLGRVVSARESRESGVVRAGARVGSEGVREGGRTRGERRVGVARAGVEGGESGVEGRALVTNAGGSRGSRASGECARESGVGTARPGGGWGVGTGACGASRHRGVARAGVESRGSGASD